MDEETPAWMQCEDMLSRIRSELIMQAMDMLQLAIDSKAIDVGGSLINLPDRPSEIDMKMFIIGKLLEEKERIMEMYSGKPPEDVATKERLDKFLLAVGQISMLMDYANAVEAMVGEIPEMAGESDPYELLRMLLGSDARRIEALRYAESSQRLLKEETITIRERELLRKALGALAA